MAELRRAEEEVARLHSLVGVSLASASSLRSRDIELDMTSSDEMVEMRDALKRKEDLEVDHFQIMRERSDRWWGEMG